MSNVNINIKHRIHNWALSIIGTAKASVPVVNETMELVVEEPVYSSTNELPFPLFEDVIINNRLTSLIKIQYKNSIPFKPVIEDSILREKWFKIYSQYCEEIGDARLLNVTKLAAKITILDSKINRIQTMVAMMRQWYIKDNESQIKADIMGVTINTSSYEAYQKSLDAVLSRSKPLVMERKILLDQYKEFQKKSNSGKPLSTMFFTMQLQQISKFIGYQILKKDLTTQEYALHVRQLNEHNEKVINQKSRAK